MTSLPQGSLPPTPTRLTVPPLAPSPRRPQLVIVSRRLSLFEQSPPKIYPIPEATFEEHEEALQTRIENDLSIGWGPFEVVDPNTLFVGEYPQDVSLLSPEYHRAPCTDIVNLWLDPPCTGASRRFACISSKYLWYLPRIGGWQVVGISRSFPWTRYLVMLVPDRGKNAQWIWVSLGALRRQLPDEWATLVHQYRSRTEVDKQAEVVEVEMEGMEGDEDEGDDDKNHDSDEGEDEYEDDGEYDKEGEGAEESKKSITQGLGRLGCKRSWDEAYLDGGHLCGTNGYRGSSGGRPDEGWRDQLQEQVRQRELGSRGNPRFFLGSWSWATAHSVHARTGSSLSPCTRASSCSSSPLWSPKMQGPTTLTRLIPEMYSSQEQGFCVCNSFTVVNHLPSQLGNPCQHRPSSDTYYTTREGLRLPVLPPAHINNTPPGYLKTLKRARLVTGIQSHIVDLHDLYDNHNSESYRHKIRKNSADSNNKLELDIGRVPTPNPACRSTYSTNDLVRDLEKPLPKSLTTWTAFAGKQVPAVRPPSQPGCLTQRPHSVTHQPPKSSPECSPTHSPLRSPATSPPPAAQTSRHQSIRTERVETSSLVTELYGSVYLQLHGKEVSVRRSARLGTRW